MTKKAMASAPAAAKAEGRGEVLAEKRHNGWSNYETWAVALWIDNEKSSHNYWREQAQQCRDEMLGRLDGEDAADHNLADRLKEDFEAGKDELLEDAQKTCSVWADLLGAALSEVDWLEIAKHLSAE